MESVKERSKKMIHLLCNVCMTLESFYLDCFPMNLESKSMNSLVRKTTTRLRKHLFCQEMICYKLTSATMTIEPCCLPQRAFY